MTPDPIRPAASAEELADQTRLGRLLTRLESDPLALREMLAALPPELVQRRSQRIGFTGSPGVGKSTLLAQLIRHWRAEQRRCGVVAVDPSSPFSGGAIMADRLRWVELAGPDLFVRSLASRGSLGGVSAGAGAVASLIEAAGYDPLLIETVGVGQTGFDVLALADTVVVLFSPESGDSLQMLKAGLLEAGDIIVLNKADRPGADAMLREIGYALELLRADDEQWQVPLLPVIASSGEGVTELAAQMAAHQAWLADLPQQHPRRLQRIRSELVYTLRGLFSQQLEGIMAPRLDSATQRIQRSELGLWDALDELRRQILRDLD